MSEQVERRLLELLDSPTESPYGNPIPGLDEIGGVAAEPFLDGVILLPNAVAAGTRYCTVRRLAEPVQFDPDLLHQLYEAGVVPGAEATIRSDPSGYIAVDVAGRAEGIELPFEVARHIYVGD